METTNLENFPTEILISLSQICFVPQILCVYKASKNHWNYMLPTAGTFTCILFKVPLFQLISKSLFNISCKFDCPWSERAIEMNVRCEQLLFNLLSEEKNSRSWRRLSLCHSNFKSVYNGCNFHVNATKYRGKAFMFNSWVKLVIRQPRRGKEDCFAFRIPFSNTEEYFLMTKWFANEESFELLFQNDFFYSQHFTHFSSYRDYLNDDYERDPSSDTDSDDSYEAPTDSMFTNPILQHLEKKLLYPQYFDDYEDNYRGDEFEDDFIDAEFLDEDENERENERLDRLGYLTSSEEESSDESGETFDQINERTKDNHPDYGDDWLDNVDFNTES